MFAIIIPVTNQQWHTFLMMYKIIFSENRFQFLDLHHSQRCQRLLWELEMLIENRTVPSHIEIIARINYIRKTTLKHATIPLGSPGRFALQIINRPLSNIKKDLTTIFDSQYLSFYD